MLYTFIHLYFTFLRPDIYNPGDEVLKILKDASYSLEDLKQQEAHLPPEDSTYLFIFLSKCVQYLI